MSANLYVVATQVRDAVTGVPIAPAAGSTVVADGVGGATWGAASASTVASLTVYVSTTGDNKNDGATPATAVQTIDTAIGIVQRRGWNVSASVRLLPGTHNLAGGRVIRSDGAPGARASLLVIEGDSLQTLGAYSVLASAVVGNLVEITISTPVPLAAEGERVRFTSGPLGGQNFIVGNVNGGTTFTVMADIAPNPGDAFVLEAASATINILNGILFTGGPRILRNLRVILPPQSGSTIPLLLVDMTLLLSGVSFGVADPSGAFIVLNRSIIASGTNILGIPGVGATPLGFSLLGQGGPNIGLICLAGSTLSTQGCYFRDTQLYALNTGVIITGQALLLRCVCGGSNGSIWDCGQTRILDSIADGINLFGSAAHFSGVDISNSAGSGIYLTDSTLRLDSGVTSLIPNADAGVRIDAHGRVTAAGAGTSVTITGTSNPDVIVGDNGAELWTDIASGAAPRNDYVSPTTLLASVTAV